MAAKRIERPSKKKVKSSKDSREDTNRWKALAQKMQQEQVIVLRANSQLKDQVEMLETQLTNKKDTLIELTKENQKLESEIRKLKSKSGKGKG